MNSRVTISKVCRTVLAGLVLSLAACSSGGDDGTAAYQPVTTADAPGIVAAGDCAAAREVAAALSSVDTSDSAGLTALPDSVRALHDVVPSELQPSVDTLSGAIEQFVSVLERFGFDAAKVDADPSARQELDALDTPQVRTAIADLQTWLDGSCTTSATPETTAGSGPVENSLEPTDSTVPTSDSAVTTATGKTGNTQDSTNDSTNDSTTGASVSVTTSSAAPNTTAATTPSSGGSQTSTVTTVGQPTATSAKPTVTTTKPVTTTTKPATTTTKPVTTTTAAATPGAQSFTVDASDPTPPVFHVALGTDITLVVNSITDQEFHLHDIDLTIGGTHVTFRFTADLPGSHIVESHDTGKLICTFVIA